MNRNNVEKDKRNLTYDLLRIIFCFGVVLIHVNGNYLYSTDVNSYTFSILNIYTGLFRCSVLIFVMVSGAHFLDPKRDLTYNKLFKKYIFRAFISLVIFNTFYILYYHFFVNNQTNIIEGIKLSIMRTFRGDPSGGQLWYLFLCLQLYLFTPILRIFVKGAKKRDIEYFLIFGFIFTIVIPTITNYWKFTALDFKDYYAYEMGVDFSVGYYFYYMLGYYIKQYMSKNKVSKLVKKIIYSLGVIGAMTTIIIANVLAIKAGYADLQRPYHYFSINVCFVSAAVFVLANSEDKTYGKIGDKIIGYLSKRTFGIYLIHMFVLVLLLPLLECMNPIIGSPAITILVFIISLIITEILGKIPIVKKYILLF